MESEWVSVANQSEVTLHGLVHHCARLSFGRVWSLTAAAKRGYLCENGPVVEGKKRQRIVPYLKANELDIEFYEINGEVFVPWADYLQLLLLYPRRTSKGGDQAELHAKQIRAVRLTLREYTGACPIEQHENDDNLPAVFQGAPNSPQLEKRYVAAKSGKNGVFYRRKNGEEYVLVQVPKLTIATKRSQLLTRCKWYCHYILPFFCSIFGDNFLALLKEYLVHTVSGKELLVDVIVQMKEEHRAATVRKRPARAGDGGSDAASATDDSSSSSSSSTEEEEEEDADEDEEEDDVATQVREERAKPPSLSRQLAAIESAAQRSVGKRGVRRKQSTRIPKELLLALGWKEHGRFAFDPAVFLKSLHNARISLGKYKDFFQELGSPKALPGPEIVRRWHTAKAKFLVEYAALEFKATPECTGVLKFEGIFEMVIKVILDKGGTFDETPDRKRIMLFRCSWDKRKIKWGQCAYQLVPLHDCFRTQHWEDVLPLLIWNGDDDSIEDIQHYGKEIIALNEKIANDQMELVVRDRTYIIRQVSSPDMKALRGGITEEFTTTEDLAVQQLQDFHYWASGTIVSARGDREEYETRLELLRQQDAGNSLLLPRLKSAFPQLIAKLELTDAELRCYKAPETHRLFCPFCRCAVHNISNSVNDPFNPWWKRRRQFKHAWGIAWSQWAYCEFHCLERIAETLLGRTHKDTEAARLWSIQFFLKLNKRMVKDHCLKLGVEVDLVGRDGKEIQISGVKLVMATTAELENPEYEKASFGMIPYKSASLIRRLHPIWIPLLNQHMEAHGFPRNNPFIRRDEVDAWAAFGEFWQTIEADSKTVSAWKQADPTFRPQVLILQNFVCKYEACYGKTKSHYMHVAVCHTAEMWERFGTLLRLSNQSTEATNYHHDVLADAISTGNGLFSTVAKDVILHRLSSLLFAVQSSMDDFAASANRVYSDWLQQCKNPANPTGPRVRRLSAPPANSAATSAATSTNTNANDDSLEEMEVITAPELHASPLHIGYDDDWSFPSNSSFDSTPMRITSPPRSPLVLESLEATRQSINLDASPNSARPMFSPIRPIGSPMTSNSTAPSPLLPPTQISFPPSKISSLPTKFSSPQSTPSTSTSERSLSSFSSPPVQPPPSPSVNSTFSSPLGRPPSFLWPSVCLPPPQSVVVPLPQVQPSEISLKRQRSTSGTTKAAGQQQFSQYKFHNFSTSPSFKEAPRQLIVHTSASMTPPPNVRPNANNTNNYVNGSKK